MKRQQVQAGKRTYIVGERLGRGASGQVYEAWRKGSKKRLALKVVPNDTQSHKTHLRSEIEALEVLGRHENVVSLHHYGLDEQSNVWFLELEFAAGGDMLKRIERGGLSEDEVRPIAYDIFSAISFAHQNNFCHRDIKLENLLFSDELQTRAIVADWGLASRFVEGVPLKQDCGSMHYAAPEILGGREYNGDKVDSFSLGILLFALTTGCFPFVGRTPRARLLDIVTREKLPFPRGFTFAIRDLLCALLETDPSIRMTATEALEHEFFATIVEARRQSDGIVASTATAPAAIADDVLATDLTEPTAVSDDEASGIELSAGATQPQSVAARQTRPRSNSRSLSPAKQKIRNLWGKFRSSPPDVSTSPSSSSSSSSATPSSKAKSKAMSKAKSKAKSKRYRQYYSSSRGSYSSSLDD